MVIEQLNHLGHRYQEVRFAAWQNSPLNSTTVRIKQELHKRFATSDDDEEEESVEMCCRNSLVLLIAAGLLSACHGGGGGGNSEMMPVQFTSFSAVKPSQPVQASGVSQTVSTASLLGGGAVQSTTINAPDTANSSAQMTFGTTAMSAFSFSTPTSSVNFSGLSVQCTPGTGLCRGSSTGSQAVIINPLDQTAPALMWNYQSFGYWLVIGSGSNSVAGAMSFGAPTPVAAIPVMGTATYRGLSGGFYVDQSGATFVHAAQMQSTVDFGPARSVAFSTSNTTLSPPNTTAPISSPALNLTGNFTITSGSNQFSGPVTTPGGTGTPAMTGTARGNFYGPTAQEIGGLFSLKGTGPQTMLGGFGGKQ